MAGRTVRALALSAWLALVVGCARPNAPRPAPAYLLRDTTAWSSMMYGGAMALLTRDGVVLDTVDLLIGVRAVPGGVVYQQVTQAGAHEECGPDGICFDLGPWVLRDGKRVRDLADLVPAMHPFHSSPNVIDSVLFYWGITAADSGTFRISAMKYDFGRGVADSTYLYSEGLETDNPGHLEPPFPGGDFIVYRTLAGRYALTRDLRIVSTR